MLIVVPSLVRLCPDRPGTEVEGGLRVLGRECAALETGEWDGEMSNERRVSLSSPAPRSPHPIVCVFLFRAGIFDPGRCDLRSRNVYSQRRLRHGRLETAGCFVIFSSSILSL